MAVCKSFRLTCNASKGSFCAVDWTDCGTGFPKTVNINGGDFAIFGWGYNYIDAVTGLPVNTTCAIDIPVPNVWWQVTNGTSVTETDTNIYSCAPPPPVSQSPTRTPTRTPATPTPTRTQTPTPTTTPVICGSGTTTGTYHYYYDCCGNFIEGATAGLTVSIDNTKPSMG